MLDVLIYFGYLLWKMLGGIFWFVIKNQNLLINSHHLPSEHLDQLPLKVVAVDLVAGRSSELDDVPVPVLPLDEPVLVVGVKVLPAHFTQLVVGEDVRQRRRGHVVDLAIGARRHLLLVALDQGREQLLSIFGPKQDTVKIFKNKK